MLAHLMNAEQNCELHNVLMDQKTSILSAIGSGQELEGLQKAAELLKFTSPLWHLLGYDYKTREMKERIKLACENLLEENTTYLAAARKNDKTRRSVEQENNKLMDLLESL